MVRRMLTARILMIPNRVRNAPPKASALLESLRGFGYSTATAIADIVDNSIAARATTVDIQFTWNGPQSTISILDNGNGMDENALESAMRLGAINPLEFRGQNDLGRFGLGLKTASFSQCRRLTVASRKHGRTNTLRWDLDLLASRQDDEWPLLEGMADGSSHLLEPLILYEQGTIVLWENLDRVVTAGLGEQEFLDLLDRVEQHLAMVFHRFLDACDGGLTIRINGRDIAPWDPFLATDSATWSSPVETITSQCGAVEIQCHVLPHKDRLNARAWEDASGANGWTAHQGFYVYRNKRLLVAGSWLGLGRRRPWIKEEQYRLARIRLDFSNEADTYWNIDVRKSRARPPVPLRERLTRIAEDARTRARRVFAHRGTATRNAFKSPLIYAWRAEHFAGGIRYRIDRDHPIIRNAIHDARHCSEQLLAMLRVLEETVPVQRIWLDTAESKDTPRTAFGGQNSDEVMAVLNVVYRNLVLRKGLTPSIARQQLLGMEPFNSFPDLIASLPDNPHEAL
jgi:hypothetical protein